jgi:hypothetical protein
VLEREVLDYNFDSWWFVMEEPVVVELVDDNDYKCN